MISKGVRMQIHPHSFLIVQIFSLSLPTKLEDKTNDNNYCGGSEERGDRVRE